MRDTTLGVAGALLVNAGADQDVQLPTTTAYLTGNVSGGTSPYTYSWTKISGSGTQSITGNTTLTPTITGLVSGTYVFRLSSTDATPQTVTDDIQITMLAACNELAPVNYTQGATGAGEIYITTAKGTKPWKGGDTVTITAGTPTVSFVFAAR